MKEITMTEVITVENLCLQYDITEKRSIRSLRFGDKNKKTVKALDNVSFTVPKGEILGIIGSNGSGKSTLLRSVAGLMAPNSGSVDLHGNSISLLSLGTGFIGELSGRDNVILSALSMGFTKDEIDEKFDSIVEFSEIGDAIDRPVKNYSSGMYSKLAFSIAIMLETDIILIDEVLSVGDMKFRAKSHAALEALINNSNKTVIIVSHNLGEIKNLCTRVMWLEFGELRAIGDPETVLELYHQHIASDPTKLSYLPAPTVRVTSCADSVTISWNNINNAIDYRVYRKENVPGSAWSQIADGYAGLEYTDVPPSDKIAYLYTVRARGQNSVGNVWSNHNPGVMGKLKK